jgi:HlyD family secretion protein
VAATRTMKRIMTGTVAVVAIAVAAAWIARSQQATNGLAVSQPGGGPLIARGYTDAPSGTVMVSGDPFGGAVLRELRIKEGQTVKRDEIIGVLSNYPAAEVAVKIAENDLSKFVMHREKVLKGQRLTDIALEEDALKSAIENDRLKKMLRVRSGTPVAEKELDSSIAEQNLQIQRASLELSKRRLQIELEQNELTIERLKAARDSALRTREEALIRSPIDGVVTQINSRQGEIASGAGIAKIVDMTQLRVFATVDELHLHRLKPGAPVQITFRGSPTVYMGKIAIAPMTVKRTKRSEADLGEANVRQVEVEIKADDVVSMPQMLGREARVTFL